MNVQYAVMLASYVLLNRLNVVIVKLIENIGFN